MEDAALIPSPEPDSSFPMTVDLKEGVGSDVYLHFSVDAPPVVTDDTLALASDIDEKALEDLNEQASQRRITFVARAGPETTAQVGDRREIHVNTRKLYFFDPATGASITGHHEVVPVAAADPHDT
jgi:multiple sugar transport system ATP-binding protein